MAQAIWNGSNGNYTDATRWSTGKVPASGDVAVISSGTVSATGVTFSSLSINLNASASGFGTLVLDTDTFDSATILTANNQGGGTGNDTITLNNTVTNNGTMTFLGGVDVLQFNSASASLINNGIINIAGASAQFVPTNNAAPALLVNSGTIRVTNPSNTAQAAVLDTAIGGTGQITLSVNAKLDLQAGVANTQTVAFTGGANANTSLQIDGGANFQATISGFEAGDQITLTNLSGVTGTGYTQTGATNGTLTVYNGSTAVATLNLSGVYGSTSFGTQLSTASNGTSTLSITTSVQNSTTGSTSSAGAGPVYRFFDKQTGAHFFTSVTTERDSTFVNLANRYVEETNGFGTAQQTDTSAVLVYRFFDTVFGTHFYTSDAKEAQGLMTQGSSTYRSDLTYEAAGNFYEHSTAQTGDVTVYRFFDKSNGTHFYTADQTEFAGLTTQGSSTYRSDLVYEQSGNFYAPAGSFA